MNFFEKITDKLCLGERGIKDVLGLVLIIGVMAGAVLANADSGMWGVAGEWNLLVSVLYILFWLVFPKLFGKSGFLMKAGYIISVYTLIAAICSSISVLAYSGQLADLFLIPALMGLPATVPFYGLTILGRVITAGFEVYYPVLAMVSLLWVLYMRQYVKK